MKFQNFVNLYEEIQVTFENLLPNFAQHLRLYVDNSFFICLPACKREKSATICHE